MIWSNRQRIERVSSLEIDERRGRRQFALDFVSGFFRFVSFDLHDGSMGLDSLSIRFPVNPYSQSAAVPRGSSNKDLFILEKFEWRILGKK